MIGHTKLTRLLVESEQSGAQRLARAFVLGIVALAAGPAWSPMNVLRPARPAPAAVQDNAEKGAQRPPEDVIRILKEEEDRLAAYLLQDFPDNPGALTLVGLIRRQQANTAEAQRCWEKSLSLDPKRPDVHSEVGWLAMRRGDYEEAAAHWRKAIELNPKLWGVHSALGRALMAMGDLEEARVVLEQGVQLSPTDTTGRFLLGEVCLQSRDFANARRHFEAAIQAQPDLTNAYYGLATACARLGDGDQAAEYRRKFADLKKKDLARLEDLNRSMDDLAAVLQRVSQSYTNAGKMYLSARRIREAERLWGRAAALAPENTECRENLFVLYRNTNRLKEALETCLQLGRIHPNNPVYAVNTANTYAELGQFGRAETAYRDAIRLDPSNPLAYRDLALMLLHTNKNPKEAQELAEKAVQLQPTAPSYLALSSARQKCGDIPGALSAIRSAIALDPQNAHYLRMLQTLEKEK